MLNIRAKKMKDSLRNYFVRYYWIFFLERGGDGKDSAWPERNLSEARIDKQSGLVPYFGSDAALCTGSRRRLVDKGLSGKEVCHLYLWGDGG